MSPGLCCLQEVLLEDDMGKETDVYSWGVLLWEMSAGARAWANLRFAQVGPEGVLGARRRLVCCADDLKQSRWAWGCAWCTPTPLVLCQRF